ncbi:MAG: M13 family metallopeptidase [Thermoplasmata archaeon]
MTYARSGISTIGTAGTAAASGAARLSSGSLWPAGWCSLSPQEAPSSGGRARDGSRGATAKDRPPASPRFSEEYLDRSVSPSEDFYRYATGGWIDTHPVPADKARWSAFHELAEYNAWVLREILGRAAGTDPPRRPPLPRPADIPDRSRALVGAFYRAAMDRARRDRRKAAPLRGDLARIRGLRSVPEVILATADAHRTGTAPLFEWFVAPDQRDSSTYAFYLYQGGLSLPDREYYLEERFAPLRRQFVSHIGRMLPRAGVGRSTARAAARSILRIETELARAGRSRTDLRDPEKNYHRFPIEEADRRYPHLAIRAYLRRLGPRRSPWLVVGQPEFFDAVDRLLTSVPVEDWRRYLAWHLLHSAAPHLDRATDRENFRFFHRAILGQRKPEPDWRRATMMVDSLLGEALGRLYVREHFPSTARRKVEELVEDLTSVMRDRLSTVPWMTGATRAAALAKLARFRSKIGHPRRFRTYAGLRVAANDHWGNVLRARSFEARRNLRRVGLPVDREEWEMTPPTVNAYFHPSMNQIVFPAGILQPPFFDAGADDALNYGGIGVVIGHEITHGFDDQGRKYDAEGNLRDWWTAEDDREFQRRARRIIDQFSQYEPLPGLKIQGALTAGENIADLGGVSIAFEALTRRLRDGRTPREPIHGFTPEQRFFLAYAQIWRMNVREEEARRLLTVDPHSPGRFRVIGPLANFPPFWEAFGIPQGSPMRRPDDARVEIW